MIDREVKADWNSSDSPNNLRNLILSHILFCAIISKEEA